MFELPQFFFYLIFFSSKNSVFVKKKSFLVRRKKWYKGRQVLWPYGNNQTSSYKKLAAPRTPTRDPTAGSRTARARRSTNLHPPAPAPRQWEPQGATSTTGPGGASATTDGGCISAESAVPTDQRLWTLHGGPHQPCHWSQASCLPHHPPEYSNWYSGRQRSEVLIRKEEATDLMPAPHLPRTLSKIPWTKSHSLTRTHHQRCPSTRLPLWQKL